MQILSIPEREGAICFFCGTVKSVKYKVDDVCSCNSCVLFHPEGDISTKLIKIRRGMGLSQREMAEKIGMHQPQLSLLEQGKKSPTLTTVSKIARRLNLKVEINFVEK